MSPASIPRPDDRTPLEYRDELARLIRARAPYRKLQQAAEAYRQAIKRLGEATGRKLPVPSRPFIIRFLS